jgi:hypothetical protein
VEPCAGGIDPGLELGLGRTRRRRRPTSSDGNGPDSPQNQQKSLRQWRLIPDPTPSDSPHPRRPAPCRSAGAPLYGGRGRAGRPRCLP